MPSVHLTNGNVSKCFIKSLRKIVEFYFTFSYQYCKSQEQQAANIQGLSSNKTRILDEESIRQYHKDGFLVATNFLTDNEKKQIARCSNELLALPETAGKWMQYYEIVDGRRSLCRTENFLEYFDELNGLVRGKLTDAVSELLGESAILYKEKINFKLPGAGGFGAHQDEPAYTNFLKQGQITVMIAADKANTQNGCVEVVRGEHQSGVLPHPGGIMEDWLVEKWEKENKWEPLEIESGCVVFFSSRLPHRSGKNRTDHLRRAYFLTFNPLSDGDFRKAYYADKREKFPPDVERLPNKDYSEGAKIYNLASPIPVQIN